MELQGVVRNGVIVLSGGQSLPEGTPVTISCTVEPSPRPRGERKRVQLPLFASGEPGTLDLTNERIAEIFEEEDVASARL